MLLYVFLCVCCQSPTFASTQEAGYCECSVEIKPELEADVSALPLVLAVLVGIVVKYF